MPRAKKKCNMKKYYSVGGVDFLIESDADFFDTEETVPFLTEASEQSVKCVFRQTDKLDIPDSKPDFKGEFGEIYGDMRTFFIPTMSCAAAVVKKVGNDFFCEYKGEYSVFFSYAKNLMNAVGLERLIIRNNAFILHCSFLELNGGAVLFSGHSGIGKSTRADMFINAFGGRLINGDRAVLCRENGVVYASGLPIAGSSEVYINKTLPLKAIVFLEKGTYTKTEKAKPVFAYKKLYENLLLNVWSADFMKKADDFMITLCESGMIYSSRCDLSPDSVNEQKNVIFANGQ